jgi:hypothetical protein
MLYKHTPHFQWLLQKALRLIAQGRAYSDDKIIREAGLECAKSTLNRFRGIDLEAEIRKDSRTEDAFDRPITRVGSYLNPDDAALLWRYLDHRGPDFEEQRGKNLRHYGMIEQAIQLENISKNTLYPISDVANAMHVFFGVHKSAIARFAEAGIHGNFFCYKPSFRRPGFTVKSLMTIEVVDNDYFSVREKQTSSGAFEMDRKSIVEKSEGFGFIKSDRMWLFLRDRETEQPRIFCFHKPNFSRPTDRNEKSEDGIVLNSRISSMYGYLLEGAKGNENNSFKYNVVLVREDVDKELWKLAYPDETYVADQQIDVYPTGEKVKSQYAQRLDERMVLIPAEIVEYLSS